MLVSTPQDRPVAFQLFGEKPDLMAEAATIMADLSPDMIDINMGCPVKKVTRKGAGAALMAAPNQAAKIIEQVRKAVSLPISVKFRLGTDSKHISSIEFAQMAEAVGASALTVHGRTWAQGFSGTADWHQIAKVKQAVSIPVIGNGDISSYSQAVELLASSGCDAVMIGRAALSTPQLFSASAPAVAGVSECCSIALRHLDLIRETTPEMVSHLPAIKNRLGRYFHSFTNCTSIRRYLYDASSMAELHARLLAVQAQQEAPLSKMEAIISPCTIE